MDERDSKPRGPDLATGVALSEFADGAMLLGNVHREPVRLEVRCPWHHACFNLRTDEVVPAPALDAAELNGQIDAHDCTITYRNDRRKLAAATISRALESLRAQVEFEKKMIAGSRA